MAEKKQVFYGNNDTNRNGDHYYYSSGFDTSSNLTDRGFPGSTGGYYAQGSSYDKNGQKVIQPYNTKTPTTSKKDNSGSSSGAATAKAYSSLLSAYLNRAQSLADSQLAAQRAAAQNAYDKSVGALNDAYNSQIGNLRSNYDSTVNQLNASYDNSANKVNANAENSLREAYINKMLSQKNLGQQMAAQGLTGGATESTLASLLNNYGNSRNNIETTKANNLSDLAFTRDNNLAEALRSFNSAMANADSTRASQLMGLESALANNQISAIGDYYGMLANENEQYNSLLKSLIGNMGKWNMTPTEVTNLVKMVNTNQASNDANSNYARLLATQLPSNGNSAVANANGTDTMANANLIAQLLAKQA